MTALDDIAEQKEWTDAIASVIAFEGTGRADDLLDEVVAVARRSGAHLPFAANTAYINTIPPDRQPPYPGNRDLENRDRDCRKIIGDNDADHRSQDQTDKWLPHQVVVS